MKSAYGEFCSKHMESVELYKVRNMSEPRDTLYLNGMQDTPLSRPLQCFFFPPPKSSILMIMNGQTVGERELYYPQENKGLLLVF